MQITVQKLFNLPFYTEGPAVDSERHLFFTALTGGWVGKVDEKGEALQWATAVCPNGQVIGPDGSHWFCDSKQRGILCFDVNGKPLPEPVMGQIAGEKIHTPNDLMLDSEGNLYFTDSLLTDGKVFFKGADGNEKVVLRGIDYANGLALSNDERFLYVAESYQNRILRVELAEPGVAAAKAEVFADLPTHVSGVISQNLPDGLAIDPQGNLWVAHYGMQAIQVLNSQGEWLFSLDTQLPLTSNLCFIEYQPERQVLLVTGGYGEPGPGAVMVITVSHSSVIL
ncbi:SMP-30/gluconolactonase/LRE family protein [Runella zeae]|uniref:SMP-30/gluconolactonase/LRE family protein n=1 Tax=Runella zeae TaxID=94255 RepID=UPI000400691A|nr:SMP-30/gluconolactonase/LRE family protein [Runella zeae]